MCVVCTDWNKGKMTDKEAFNALGEMINSADIKGKDLEHYLEVSDKILDKEFPVNGNDNES